MKQEKPYMIKLPTFTAEVTRKAMKSIRLRVFPDGQVRLSVPRSMPKEEIRQFLLRRQGWIEEQLSRFSAAAEPADDEHLLLFGRALPIRIQSGNRFSLTLTDTDALLTCPETATPEQRRRFLVQQQRLALAEAIDRRLPYWEERTGLRCDGYQIRSMKSRWGSCTVQTRRLRFALQLAAYPLSCLDYVIVHELCHLSVPNHGEAFKALLTRHMPDWPVHRQRLRRPPA